MTKHPRNFLMGCASLVLFSPAIAQMDHSAHTAPAAKVSASAAAMGEGLVKKIDKVKGTVTLAHGALPNGMPAMTMAYKVKDPAWLDAWVLGQKIRFTTDPADGGMSVQRWEPVK